jgi:hypothetical protein
VLSHQSVERGIFIPLYIYNVGKAIGVRMGGGRVLDKCRCFRRMEKIKLITVTDVKKAKREGKVQYRQRTKVRDGIVLIEGRKQKKE